jgi:predicted dithiol-disulfide oxidoreductase (DUF899 family)
MNKTESTPSGHTVVSRDQWLLARKELLKREKELTRLHDQVSAERRALPRVKVEKEYVFDAPEGKVTLSGLFGGYRQLIVHHFMFGPGWKEGCFGCSFHSDHVDGALVHLLNHGVGYVRVSRAPLPEIEAFNRRMGWHARWVSSFGSDFNFDFHVSASEADRARGKVDYNYAEVDCTGEEMSGVSVFWKDEAGTVYHTYSTFGRGDEGVLGTYFFLDITPVGRNENGPGHNLSDWVRHHDRYSAGGPVDATGLYVAPPKSGDCCHSEGAG